MSKSKPHTQEQVGEILKELQSQTDRGTAIIAAAVMDDLLNQLITSRLIDLGSERHDSLFSRTNAPLSSFSSRIEMAFALGVLSNEARLGLHLIRDVRNAFAHRIEQIQFDHPEVAQMIQSRAMPLLKRLQKTNRDVYLDTFTAIAFIIYGTLSLSDFRIRPLEDTHSEPMLAILSRYSETVAAAVREVQEESSSLSPKL
jgi:DNA-binding MltR family transcriptional regulator